jgi:chromosome transmission fidelity protein 1
VGHAGLKFIQLNASLPFKEVVEKAHAVVLAGGTLAPVAGIISQLLPHVPARRIDVFSCGHVIPPENLVGLAVAR